MEVKPVVGFPNYLVSDTGKVFNTIFRNRFSTKVLDKPRELKVGYNFGYCRVRLCDQGRIKDFFVHDLVLAAFVGPRPKGFDASHLNGIRTDCRLSNLAWESKSDNCQRKKMHGTAQVGSKNPYAKLTESHVVEIKSQLSAGVKQRDIAKTYNTSEQNISRIKFGRRWNHV